MNEPITLRAVKMDIRAARRALEVFLVLSKFGCLFMLDVSIVEDDEEKKISDKNVFVCTTIVV